MEQKYKLTLKTDYTEVTTGSTYTIEGVLDLIKVYTEIFSKYDIKEYRIIPVEGK